MCVCAWVYVCRSMHMYVCMGKLHSLKKVSDDICFHGNRWKGRVNNIFLQPCEYIIIFCSILSSYYSSLCYCFYLLIRHLLSFSLYLSFPLSLTGRVCLQIEELEQKYGGPLISRRAACKIQTAFRQYQLSKNFQKIRNSVLESGIPRRMSVRRVRVQREGFSAERALMEGCSLMGIPLKHSTSLPTGTSNTLTTLEDTFNEQVLFKCNMTRVNVMF